MGVQAIISAGVYSSTAKSKKKEAKEVELVADVSAQIEKSKSIPTGYKGAEGKVKVEKGKITTTSTIEGKDAGFFVEFRPVPVKNANALVLDIKGYVYQKQGWAKYGSIQVIDEDGKRHILKELCQSKWDDCQEITKIKEMKEGITLQIDLPKDLKSIKRFEVVFVGVTEVDPGFTIDNILLMELSESSYLSPDELISRNSTFFPYSG